MKYLYLLMLSILLMGSTTDTISSTKANYEKSMLIKNKLHRIEVSKSKVVTHDSNTTETTTVKDSVSTTITQHTPKKEELTIVEFAVLILIMAIAACILTIVAVIIDWITK